MARNTRTPAKTAAHKPAQAKSAPSKPTKTVSVKTVAEVAGVSAQTVSRVLNHTGQVSEATRAKVEKAMRQVGYRPNFAARALRRGTFHTLGVVMFNIHATGNLGELEGINKAAEKSGYALTLKIMNDEPYNLAELYSSMKLLPVDGIILLMDRTPSDIDTFTPSPDLPMVAITSTPISTLSTVDADQVEAGKKAVELFLQAGHRTVYCVSGPDDSISSLLRLRGWRSALQEHHAPIPEPCPGDWTVFSGYHAGLTLVDAIRAGECTAIFCANDEMASGVAQALNSYGLSVPHNVSLIGVDNSLDSLIPSARPTSFDQNFSQVGATAVDMVMKQIGSLEPQPVEHRSIAMRLVARHSIKKLN